MIITDTISLVLCLLYISLQLELLLLDALLDIPSPLLALVFPPLLAVLLSTFRFLLSLGADLGLYALGRRLCLLLGLLRFVSLDIFEHLRLHQRHELLLEREGLPRFHLRTLLSDLGDLRT